MEKYVKFNVNTADKLSLLLMSDHDPFSDWSQFINRPVYAVDGKKLGFLRSILAD